MSERFIKVDPKTALQNSLQKTLQLDLVQLKNTFNLYNQDIIFTKNITKAEKKYYKNFTRSDSIMRQLLNTTLSKVASTLDKSKIIIDIAGGGITG